MFEQKDHREVSSMNTPSRIQHRLALVPLLALMTACGAPPPPQPEVALTSVEEIQKEAGQGTPIGDKAAARHYEELDTIFGKGLQNQLRFRLYRLKEPQRDFAAYLQQRADILQIGEARLFYPDDEIETPLSPESSVNVPTVGLWNDRVELSYNLDNGSELFVDNERFHGGKGVPAGKIGSDTFYFDLAKSYLGKILQADLRDVMLYPYKLRRYMDAISEELEKGGTSETIATVSQIGVSYNSALDGIAVIGPGGKAVVHMDPEGEVVGHEILLRAIAEPVADITGNQLVAPQAALQATRKNIAGRGIKLDDYRLARSEFGYLRYGRNNLQGLVAPHFAFMFEPANDGIIGRKIVEILPAIAEPELASLIAKDAERDQVRKQAILDRAGEPDPRKPLQQPAVESE
jgi:hypothetical protein